MDFKKRLMRTALMSFVALIVGAGIGFYQIQNQNAAVVSKGSSDVAGIKIGGPFELIDHNEQTVTEKNYAGQYKLIYFGFTYCPAICPTELQKISKVLKDLGDDAEKIQPLFVSVDPERDTVAVMKDYVSLFHPRLVGLTGSRAQIDEVLQDYRVYAKKVQNEEYEEYTMDHSSFIYLMDPNDELLSVYRIKDTAPFVLADIKRKLGK